MTAASCHRLPVPNVTVQAVSLAISIIKSEKAHQDGLEERDKRTRKNDKKYQIDLEIKAVTGAEQLGFVPSLREALLLFPASIP